LLIFSAFEAVILALIEFNEVNEFYYLKIKDWFIMFKLDVELTREQWSLFNGFMEIDKGNEWFSLPYQ
jgi:hypothetical protein